MKKKPNIFEVYGMVHNSKVDKPTNTRMASPISVGRKTPVIVDGKFSLHESLNQSQKPVISMDTKRKFLEIVSTFGSYRRQLERREDLQKAAKTIGGIVEAARELTLTEAGDANIDPVTVKRNMKELQKLQAEFDKTCDEASKVDQRLQSIYEEMGTILNRYYEISDISDDEVQQRLGEKKKKRNTKL